MDNVNLSPYFEGDDFELTDLTRPDFYYIFTLKNGKKIRVELKTLVSIYEYKDTDQPRKIERKVIKGDK